MKREKQAISPELRLEMAEQVASGKMNCAEAARAYGSHQTSVRYWTALYKEHGPAIFADIGVNNLYSPEFKMKAVQAYLNGEGSLFTIAAKLGLRRSEQLRRWVKMYNNGKEFKPVNSGGCRMTTSITTSQDERLRIVKDCLANGKNYVETANKYAVTYQQVRSWVQKYSELGEAGLEDRRGKRKANQEPRNELEEYKIKVAQLEKELYWTRAERDLLKKVKELESQDLCHK